MNRRRLLQALVAVVAAVTLFAYGVAVGARKIFPYEQLAALSDRVEEASPRSGHPAVDEVVQRRFREQLPRLLRIDSTADARETRRRLAAYVWGASVEEGWGRRPAVERDVERPPGTPDAAVSVDRYVIELPWGITSTAYLLTPRQETGSLVIYHEGHEGTPTLPTEVLDHLLRAGHAVMAMQMPLIGRNNRPYVQTPVGPLHLRTHNHLRWLSTGERNPLGLFLEPVRAIVESLSPRYDRIAMAGLSGGGWTTTVYAAIDPRIAKSYPVAGSQPIPLLQSAEGDWEQNEPGLYTIAEYLDLYVLGATGRGRSQLQILNVEDPCCFSGRGYRLYADAVARRVRAVEPGRFAVRTYSEPRAHKVTEDVLRLITEDLGG